MTAPPSRYIASVRAPSSMLVAGSIRSFQAMPLRSPFVQRSWLSRRQRIAMSPPSFAKTLPLRVYEREAFSFMSLSLIMTARSSVSESLYFLAEDDTASDTVRHCDGVQAGVCQRIFSLTAQMVLVRQSSEGAPGSVLRTAAGTAGGLAMTTWVGLPVEALAPGVETPWKATA